MTHCISATRPTWVARGATDDAITGFASTLGAPLDTLARLPATSADPELARLLIRLAQLPDYDRAAIKRTIALALGER